MKKKFDIVGFGSILVDDLAVIPHFPCEDTKVEILKGQKQLGGPVPTALKTLSQLGLRTSFIGKVGDDENGQYIKDTLFTSDVAIKNIVTEPKSKSGYAQVWIDSNSNSRTIAYSSGSLSPISSEEYNFNNFPAAKFLHIDGRNHECAIDLIKYFKANGSYISIDTGSFREKTLKLLNHTDIIIMPKMFAKEMYGDDSLQGLLLKTNKKYPHALLTIITDGKNGSAAIFKDKLFVQESFDVDVVDTTGAGDVHAAGILFGLCNNWKIETILEFAAATAAIKCKSLGNTTLPSLPEVQAFIKHSRTCKDIEILFS